MTPLHKRKKRRYINSVGLNTEGPRKKNLLVIILTLIILFESTIILSLITKRSPAKSVAKVRVETKKIIPKAPQPIIPIIGVKKLPPVETEAVPQKIKGEIAIVIDDWGYSRNNLDLLREINFPLTLAVLPFRDYSKQIAAFGYENNYEIIVHMPMEPEDSRVVNLEPKTLMIYMTRGIIDSILDEAFEEIRYAKGVNNHMGSLATQNKSFMTTVFRNLKKRNAYFLDSYVISDSVADLVSKEVGIKFAQRAVFIDNELEPEYIRSQLNKLARESEEYGKAIGICHEKEGTLLLLKEELPRLARRGYKFVYVSDVVK
jgi:polysaccharide deacetylase 2 family uncharacterized protein YibQ